MAQGTTLTETGSWEALILSSVRRPALRRRPGIPGKSRSGSIIGKDLGWAGGDSLRTSGRASPVQGLRTPLRSVQNDMASGFLAAYLLPEAIPWAKVGSASLTLPSCTRDRRDDNFATALFSALPALDKRSVFWYNGLRIGNLNR
jgi:hypothetical protein